MYRLLVKNAKQVVLVCNKGETLLKGNSMNDVVILNEGYSLVIDEKGNLACIDVNNVVYEKYSENDFDKIIDATGCSIIPGLVDGHTHPVFAGDRVHEFAMKLAGASYLDIHKSGGGINFTVSHVRKANEKQLFDSLREILMRMLRAGTTLMEAKSGYGLDTKNEMKMLRVLERAKNEQAIEISSTYCGGHAIPLGSTPAEATHDIVTKQLPALKSLMDSGKLHVDNIDVFCEKGVFELSDTEKILKAGKKIGLAINFHAEELNQLNSVELGVSLGARSISHLEEISEEGIKMMASSSSVAVVLPTTAYILKLCPPPIRKMIDEGVAIALGSDFNPNAFCVSMPLVMHLACVLYGMTMNEALVASTINAAASIGKSHSHGSLEYGKVGDILILDCPRWEHLIYQLAGHDHVIKHVIKKGRVVYSRQDQP